MKRKVKIISIAIFLALLLMAWAPWLNNQALHDQILQEKARIDGTIDKQTGELICDYNVMWFPFGRWVASCEGGYFVTFLGQMI